MPGLGQPGPETPAVTLNLSPLLSLPGPPSPPLWGWGEGGRGRSVNGYPWGVDGSVENAHQTVAMRSPHKSSFLLRLVTSSPGRAGGGGALLNAQLRSTEGETEAHISAWPEASQVRVVETGTRDSKLPALPDVACSPRGLSPSPRSALSKALPSSQLLGTVPR